VVQFLEMPISKKEKEAGLLSKSAAHSIVKLAADPHYVGGRVGVMAVLHTWGANLSYPGQKGKGLPSTMKSRILSRVRQMPGN